MIAYVLILAGFMLRLLPHAPNMVPVAAIAVFAGVYLDKKMVPWVPLAIMVASDVVLGLHDLVLYTWGSFLLIGFLGMWLRNHKSWQNIFGMSVFSALLFFFVTNFGVWMAWYPHTWKGLEVCYINAIPFLRNTMVSNIIFTFVLFGAYELARKAVLGSRFKAVLIAE